MRVVQEPTEALNSISVRDTEKPKKKPFNMGKKRRGNAADDILGALGDELK